MTVKSALLGLWVVITLISGRVCSQELTVAVFNSPPFMYTDESGSWSGMDIDILHEIEKRSSLHFKLVQCPWPRCLFNVNEGHYDIITNIAKTPVREKTLEFLPVYHNVPIAVYVRKGDAESIKEYTDLYKYKIGVGRGMFYFEAFNTDEKIKKVFVASPKSMLKMLVGNRVDAYINYQPFNDYYAKELGYENAVEQADYRIKADHFIHMAVSKQSAFIDKFAELQHIFEDMKADQTIDNIRAKYGYDSQQE